VDSVLQVCYYTSMNEILITLTLLIPPATQGVHWDMGEIHNQIQVTFPSGVQASYSAVRVPCHTSPEKPGWAIYHSKSVGQELCYLTDTNYPVMVRGPWITAIIKTFKTKDKQ